MIFVLLDNNLVFFPLGCILCLNEMQPNCNEKRVPSLLIKTRSSASTSD